jgi:hypothetical protein
MRQSGYSSASAGQPPRQPHRSVYLPSFRCRISGLGLRV